MWFLRKSKDQLKIEQLENEAEIYRERNKQLEEEMAFCKDLKLKYEITKMLLDDDPIIDEMLEHAKKILAWENHLKVNAKREAKASPPPGYDHQLALAQQQAGMFHGRYGYGWSGGLGVGQSSMGARGR